MGKHCSIFAEAAKLYSKQKTGFVKIELVIALVKPRFCPKSGRSKGDVRFLPRFFPLNVQIVYPHHLHDFFEFERNLDPKSIV